MEKTDRLKTLVERARHMVFFGGAGVSTESGIPDFRSVDGLYSQKYDRPPEEYLSHGVLEREPEAFFRFYREKLLYPDAQPGPAHNVLARWEAEGKLLSVVTQNVDGLHQAAGSRRVWELHGSAHRNYCVSCGRTYDLAWLLGTQGVPHCEACGAMVRPDVVLYGEGLDDGVIRGAVQDIARADLLLVAGTSLAVYPAAGLLRYFRGDALVLINKTPTPVDETADLVLHAPVGQVLSALSV